MATNDATSAPIDDDRVNIAREAAWQIEALADCIGRELAGTEELAARSIAVRIKKLACIQMDALCDETLRETVAHLHLELTGAHLTQEVGHG